MISVDITSKAFGSHTVLRDISFTIEKGETLAILGPSGIGKSTLLRIVAGVDTRFEGVVNRPQRMAIVFQEPTLLPWRNVLQNIMLIHKGLSKEEALAAIARVGLADKTHLFPNQLSLGQQRRLTLARAFAARPELLIMDEPFASLDKTTADEMISLTQSLSKDINPAIIFVTHAASEAERLATRILQLAGSPATIKEMT